MVIVRHCLKPKAPEVRVDLVDRDSMQPVGRKPTLRDDRIVDVSSRADLVVEVWERVKDVQSGAPEDAEVLFGDVVEERVKLAFARVERFLVLDGGDAWDVRELWDEDGVYLASWVSDGG
jgi:hypothetical protein